MIEIPENPKKRDFDAEADTAVKEVLKDMERSPEHRCGCLSLNHGQSHFHVMNDVAAKVAGLFKARGYHAHYCHSIHGVAHTLEITTYPTNNDI